jgi:DNA-directed RNA polymerase sigma subunit (sigma70/sigma32)
LRVVGSHAAASCDPADVLVRQEQLVAATAALRTLDARSIDAVLSTLIHDETLASVADRWGVSPQRVQQIRRRALNDIANLVRYGERRSNSPAQPSVVGIDRRSR